MIKESSKEDHFEKNFQEQILIPELEKRKQDLAEKRKLFKPIDRYPPNNNSTETK